MRWTEGPVEATRKWYIWLAGPRSPWSFCQEAIRVETIPVDLDVNRIASDPFIFGIARLLVLADST